MKRKFIVELEMPPGATVTDVKQYIEDAVNSWRGSLRPPNWDGEGGEADPLWFLKAAKVTLHRRPKSKRPSPSSASNTSDASGARH